MNDELSQLTDDKLQDIKLQCEETLEAVSNRITSDSSAQEGLRRLLIANDMLVELHCIELESRDLAALLLQGAVAVLVNTESLKTINSEIERRIGQRN
jgi:hypothetical protein